jgi:hypothetical protein
MKSLHRLASGTLLLLLSSTTVSLHAQYGPPQGPPPGAYQGQGGWDGPPNEFNDVMRRGFHDGIEGARKDYENHRPPNVNNRDEFRHPSVPGPLRHDYRVGFRRGYDAGVRHMMGGGPH